MEDAPEPRLVNRMIRASRLDRELYAEVAADITATRQAAAVVVITALASFVSDQIAPVDLSVLGVPADDSGASLPFITGLVFSPIAAILAWLAWSGVTWFVGTRVIPAYGPGADFLPVARATGFAQAPSIIGVATFIPTLGFFVLLGTWIWLLATAFVAIRTSMHLSAGQAIATMAISIVGIAVIGGILFVIARMAI